MNIEQEIIRLITEVAELKAQVAIMWKSFYGIIAVLVADLVWRFMVTAKLRRNGSTPPKI